MKFHAELKKRHRFRGGRKKTHNAFYVQRCIRSKYDLEHEFLVIISQEHQEQIPKAHQSIKILFAAIVYSVDILVLSTVITVVIHSNGILCNVNRDRKMEGE